MTLAKRLCVMMCVCLLMVGAAVPALSETAPPDAYTAYIEAHARSFPLADDLPEMDDLRGYDVFLIGEYHGIQQTYEAELDMIKWLHRNLGIRNILVEYSVIDGIIIDTYLQTGDETELLMRMDNTRGTLDGSHETLAFHRDLYAYNQGLDEAEKLRVYGIDMLHQATTGMYYLGKLMPPAEEPVPEAIADAVGRVRRGESRSITAMVENHALYPELYQAYFGAEYEALAAALVPCTQGVDYYAKPSYVTREQYMMDNAQAYFDAAEDAKCIIILGRDHMFTHKATISTAKSVGGYLAHEAPQTKGKTVGINLIYVNCEYKNMAGNAMLQMDTMNRRWKTFANAQPETMTFCRIDAPDSPFLDDATTNLYQYVVCIRDGEATTPYDTPLNP